MPQCSEIKIGNCSDIYQQVYSGILLSSKKGSTQHDIKKNHLAKPKKLDTNPYILYNSIHICIRANKTDLWSRRLVIAWGQR